jgi:hypothetical protein
MSIKPAQAYRLRLLTDRHVKAQVALAFAGAAPPEDRNDIYAESTLAKRALYRYIRKLGRNDAEENT